MEKQPFKCKNAECRTPELPYLAKGFCRNCYARERRRDPGVAERERKNHRKYYSATIADPEAKADLRLRQRERSRKRLQDPEAKARALEYHREWSRRPEQIERRAAYSRERYKNPEIKERLYAYRRERLKDPEARSRRNKYARDHAQRSKYGISLSEKEDMASKQMGLCKICLRPPGQKGLVTDHCHATGKVRALLCHSCNSALGLFRDDVSLLARAGVYLIDTRREIRLALEVTEHEADE